MFPKNWLYKKCPLGIMIAGVLIAGCAQILPTRELITIRFTYPQYTDAGQYEQWAQQFHEQNPDITVELTPVGENTYNQLTSGDVFVGSQMSLLAYLDQNQVINLSAFIEQDEDLGLDDFYPNAVKVFTTQGKQWALPVGIDMMMLYYNKDLFDRYGVAYPKIGWNWQDFVESAQMTTEYTRENYGFALQYGNEFALYEPMMMIYQHGGRLFDNLENPSQITFNDPLNVEAMDFYAKLIFEHHVAPSWNGDAQPQSSMYPWIGIMQSRYAMWTLMYSNRGGQTWPQPWEMKWGVVPLPADQNAATLATVDGAYISVNSLHPDEAWLWAEFLSKQTPAFAFPARRSLAESQQYEQLVGADIAAAARSALESAILVNPRLSGFEQSLEALGKAFDAIRKGTATPQEALDAAQQAGF
ncbi:MAG: sugar ABC transporter substrate-binding protein [Anaerolineae bacterium]|nr:sugar ABC transporter substrate-binding protein [Anaerolineae bacterium]